MAFGSPAQQRRQDKMHDAWVSYGRQRRFKDLPPHRRAEFDAMFKRLINRSALTIEIARNLKPLEERWAAEDAATAAKDGAL